MKYSINVQVIFVIIGLIFGMLFLVVNPPFQASDESVHFYKSSDIAFGNIVPVEDKKKLE